MMANSIWACTKCAEQRSWGYGKPERETAILFCSECKEATDHEFHHVGFPEERRCLKT